MRNTDVQTRTETQPATHGRITDILKPPSDIVDITGFHTLERHPWERDARPQPGARWPWQELENHTVDGKTGGLKGRLASRDHCRCQSFLRCGQPSETVEFHKVSRKQPVKWHLHTHKFNMHSCFSWVHDSCGMVLCFSSRFKDNSGRDWSPHFLNFKKLFCHYKNMEIRRIWIQCLHLCIWLILILTNKGAWYYCSCKNQ